MRSKFSVIIINTIYSIGVLIPEHAGNCANCSKPADTRSHSLIQSEEARAEAALFYNDIRAAGTLGEVHVARLNQEKGNMLGVLLCVDAAGETQVLRAFSGAIDDTGTEMRPGIPAASAPRIQAQLLRSKPIWFR